MKITKFLRKRITKDEKQARKAIKERERRDYVNPAGALAPEHTLQSWQARNFRRHPRTQCPVGTRRGVRTPSRLRPRLD